MLSYCLKQRITQMELTIKLFLIQQIWVLNCINNYFHLSFNQSQLKLHNYIGQPFKKKHYSTLPENLSTIQKLPNCNLQIFFKRILNINRWKILDNQVV